MNYNILAIILLLIVVGLLAKMQQTREHFEILSRLEKGKRICQSQSFKPWTLTFPDDIEVDNIVNTVLQYINKKLDMNYHLGKFDHVTKEYDFDGNTRYLIDFFSYHLDPSQKNDINRRFILDVTRKVDNNLTVNLLTVGNAKKYKHPRELELPSTEDNELILKDTNLQNIHHIIGRTNPPLDYGIYTNNIDSKHLSNVKHNYQSWILPQDAVDKQENKVFPCRRQYKWWDKDGVHKTDEKSESCIGLNTATVPRFVTAEFQATHGKLLSEPNDYTWLFSKSRGDQSSKDPLSGQAVDLFH
jgi:hypothetical protein